ncbi:MAG: nucleoside deaminase [Proteobacteria bacterium]|nr:nucleoside deaminase [Pseudomonadota bacterium]MBU1736990.1 nucleoside deaminase [Pseudomonadota bacterium]
MDTLPKLKAALAGYHADQDYPDEPLGIRCCELACEALEKGCYGVGAILVDTDERVLAEAGNEIFHNGFHSERHAEMVAIDHFEKHYPDFGDRSGLTMMVSLEPCPMCLTRLLLAGIGKVVYLAADDDGGMVRRIKHLPPTWVNLATIQQHRTARVSKFLADLAFRLAGHSLEALRRQLIKAIR